MKLITTGRYRDLENRIIKVPGNRYETILSPRDFEDLLDKYVSSEAADYYRDSMKAVITVAEDAIVEIKTMGGLTDGMEKELSEWV
jgi:hypothetical protein